ncbi:protein kinase C-binding protein 1-like isoform X2 [Mercenaria mercenaria]|uniref:protein kinase C-binding protein 1-like isoform X2 n=1 Tax=Mercenaria mercenaria TaxID=6596 RepID=UPI00234FB076|nr:protein kinase C-binding protein 1-like isoform X2 [Mercenaria mercenaria]
MDMDSSLPLNLDSSLPDKNFKKPAYLATVGEVQHGSKLAEKFSKKLLETIQKTVDEMCSEVLKEKSDTKTIELLNQKIGQARWNYCAELNELKHNFQLTMYEMKTGWESEKEQIVKALTAKHHAEKELAVKEAKKKQWCAQCGKEAIFYCCWNTSYCDYPCQQNHWPQHMHTCLQTNKDKTASSSSNSTINQGQQGQSHSVSQSPASIPVSVGPSATPQTSASVPTPPNPGPGSAGMMFNMQQIQRTRFLGQQQMAMQVQQRSSLSQAQQQGNPRMLFSQPLVQQTVYPLQIQPQQQLAQQQLGGTILFQNPQQNLMTYGMAPRPY